jgi:hypothetical protein
LDDDNYPSRTLPTDFVESNCREVIVDSSDNVILAGRTVKENGVDLGSIVKMDLDFVVDEEFENPFVLNDANDGGFRTVFTVKELEDGYLVGGSMETDSDPARANLVKLNFDGTLNTDFPVM